MRLHDRSSSSTPRTFQLHGYDVVVIGRRDGLQVALAAARLPRIDHVDPVTSAA